MYLGVNIDHIATLREARKINEPDPLEALGYLKNAGAHQVTLHLREDRRHIVDWDVRRIIESSVLPVNVESSVEDGVLDYICSLKPFSITLVPEKREEVTTEGGLDVNFNPAQVQRAIDKIKKAGIIPALFIDPILQNIHDCKKMGAEKIELHTGKYANLHLMAYSNLSRTHHSIKEFEMPQDELIGALEKELHHIQVAALEASTLKMGVAAGHGLNLYNLDAIVNISSIQELNIGHSIMARAIFIGLQRAVEEILQKCSKNA